MIHACLSIIPSFQLKSGRRASDQQVPVALQPRKCNFYLSGLFRMGWHTTRGPEWMCREPVPGAHCSPSLGTQHPHASALLWWTSRQRQWHASLTKWITHVQTCSSFPHKRTPNSSPGGLSVCWCSLLLQFSPNPILIPWKLNIKMYS